MQIKKKIGLKLWSLFLKLVYWYLSKKAFNWTGEKTIWSDQGDGGIRKLKDILQLLNKVIPDVTLPTLDTEEARYLFLLKKYYLKRLELTEKNMRAFYAQIAGVTGYSEDAVEFEIDDLKIIVSKGFDIAILVVEHDSFYRDRVMDGILLIISVHEETKKEAGEDYLEKYVEGKLQKVIEQQGERLKNTMEKRGLDITKIKGLHRTPNGTIIEMEGDGK